MTSAPTPNDTPIQTLDANYLLELQAAFGALVLRDPELTRFLNSYAPLIFATGLFTSQQEFRITEDGEAVEPTRSAVEAEEASIGWIRSVSTAFGQYDDSITVEPSDSEVDADTEIAAL